MEPALFLEDLDSGAAPCVPPRSAAGLPSGLVICRGAHPASLSTACEEAWRFPLVAAAPARLTRPNGPFINGLRTSRKSTKRTREGEAGSRSPHRHSSRLPRLPRLRTSTHNIKYARGNPTPPLCSCFRLPEAYPTRYPALGLSLVLIPDRALSPPTSCAVIASL